MRQYFNAVAVAATVANAAVVVAAAVVLAADETTVVAVAIFAVVAHSVHALLVYSLVKSSPNGVPRDVIQVKPLNHLE